MNQYFQFPGSNMAKTFTFFFTILLSTLIPAQSVKTEHVQVELISEVQSIKPGKSFWVALRIMHNSGWHTYWRNAGDAGLETRIDWQLPQGFTAGEIMWPYPEVISSSDVTDYGYYGELLLMTEIKPPTQISETKIKIIANAKWLVCYDICVPESGGPFLLLPVKIEQPMIDEKWVDAFSTTRNKLPVKKHEWKLTALRTDSSVVISARNPDFIKYDLGEIRFFPYEGGIFSNSTKQIYKQADSGFSIEIMFDEFRFANPQNLSGILVSANGWQGENSEKAIEVNLDFEK